jgi:MarR family transcriptional regulator, organic hydroperoxide resistance regulator
VTAAELDELRGAFSELMGAERRLRSRAPKVAGDLSHAQVRALIGLEKEGGEMTAGAMAKRAELSAGALTAMLDHLEAAGMIARRRSEEDRRQVIVTLTATGREKLAAKRARWEAYWQELLAGHSDAELQAAASVMRTISGMLDGIGRED